MPETDAELHRLARRRVKLKMGWYLHAAVYTTVNLGLWAIDRSTGGQRWHVWPLLGWGLGLAIHGVMTWFALGGGGIRERMVQRMVQRELQRLRDGR